MDKKSDWLIEQVEASADYVFKLVKIGRTGLKAGAKETKLKKLQEEMQVY